MSLSPDESAISAASRPVEKEDTEHEVEIVATDPNGDLTNVGSVLPSNENLLSGESKGHQVSNFTCHTATTVRVCNRDESPVDVSSVEKVSEKRDESPEDLDLPRRSTRHHLIFCIISISLLVGSVCFIIFGTGLLRHGNESALRGNADPGDSPVPTHTPANEAPVPKPTQSLSPNLLYDTIKPLSGDVLDDPTSPQYQVYQWMTNVNDAMNTDDARILQRYSLLTLYTALRGEIPSFASADECLWPAITCGTYGSEYWQVSEIRMARQNLIGIVPGEIGVLSTSLVYLDLAENPLLSSSIPDELYELTNLKYLYLHDNAMTGTLSEAIDNLQELEEVYLGSNRFTGTVPYNIGSRQGSRSLRKLILRDNQLEGRIPTGMALSHAIYVDMSSNRLSGSLPDDIGYNFTSLRQLLLDHNELTGTVPESYAMAGNGSLITLDLSYNKLSGGIPSTWVDDKDKDATSSINTINVKNNSLTENIDNSICNLEVMKGGSLVELGADCDVCRCNDLCSDCKN